MNLVQTRSLGSRVVSYFRDPAVSAWRKLAGVAALAYLFLPIDAVPDVVPIVGWLDDLGIVSAAAWFVVREIQRHRPEGK